ncbi:hypothetical protein CBR_g45391 [Chara braunii]|uniref:amino-acid N-acetyltransferase n=1 Tax=Chara braunii TaxID=69332 RepID=A0A388LYI9_CHABU|nr:hypothetical protein CBR_g45391 [Chara braunii]|eukprot:GBG87331.1 hypothetical protein CBR_g45391 [Chara braunii]
MEVVALTGSRSLFAVRDETGSVSGCRSGLGEGCSRRGGGKVGGERSWRVQGRSLLLGERRKFTEVNLNNNVLSAATMQLEAAQPAAAHAAAALLPRSGSGSGSGGGSGSRSGSRRRGLSCELCLKKASSSERRPRLSSSARPAFGAIAPSSSSSSTSTSTPSLRLCRNSGGRQNGGSVRTPARAMPIPWWSSEEDMISNQVVAETCFARRRSGKCGAPPPAHRRAAGHRFCLSAADRFPPPSTTVSTMPNSGSIGENADAVSDDKDTSTRNRDASAEHSSNGDWTQSSTTEEDFGSGDVTTSTTTTVNGTGGEELVGGGREQDECPGDELRAAAEKAEEAYQRQFVSWFRESWPYIQEHRGCTFVLVIPGKVVTQRKAFYGILQDVALLHGLGIRMLLVVGASELINSLLRKRGAEASFALGHRVTDEVALEAAMEAAGRIRVDIEAKLSKGPAIPMLRRHGKNDRWHDVGISVSSGNYVAAKRVGVVDGVDFGATGEVKKLDTVRIRERLSSGCVVVLSNLGYSSTGDVLNCNTYDVARSAAISLGADKLLCMTDGPVLADNGRIIKWMTLQQGEALIREHGGLHHIFPATGHPYHPGSGPNKNIAPGQRSSRRGKAPPPPPPTDGATAAVGVGGGGDAVHGKVDSAEQQDANQHHHGQQQPVGKSREEEVPSSSKSTCARYLAELATAVDACTGGVRRVHLIDSSVEGALLLELYTRDGMGTMISNDMYEGMRAARRQDLEAIANLLAPLQEIGVLVKRSEKQLLQELPYYTVIERDANIIACAALFPHFQEKCAEVASFVVSPDCRGHGLGDNLLAYVEKHAAEMGLERLFLLTTRTADWFVQRGFLPADSCVIPEERRAKINLQRNSKYFLKNLKEHRSAVGRASGATHTSASVQSELRFYRVEDDEEEDAPPSPSPCRQSANADPLGEFDW